MTEDLLRKVVEALRDTAGKATEHESIVLRSPHYIDAVESSHEKYSRDWIAGRLLGMADAIEALALPKQASE